MVERDRERLNPWFHVTWVPCFTLLVWAAAGNRCSFLLGIPFLERWFTSRNFYEKGSIRPCISLPEKRNRSSAEIKVQIVLLAPTQ